MFRKRIALLFLVLLTAFAGILWAQRGVDVKITEWDVPSPNSRPHDAESSRDGSLWWTGQLRSSDRPDPAIFVVRTETFNRYASHGEAAAAADR